MRRLAAARWWGRFAICAQAPCWRHRAKAGTYVEIKNSTIGEDAKVPHLSYIGDAEIGRERNIGAGGITANYDGETKQRTVIGKGVHTSCDNVFVAPVTIGDKPGLPPARSLPTTFHPTPWGLRVPVKRTSRDMESESVVSVETPIPLFASVRDGGSSGETQGAPSTWVERTPQQTADAVLRALQPRAGRADRRAVRQSSLAEVTLKTFTNGEVYARYEESIRGADVFIVQSCSTPSPNDSLMELLIMVQAARLASAKRVTAVMPWYPYVRQDKKGMPREPITAKLVADILEAAGVDRVLTMDLHAGQVQGFFTTPVDHMTAVPMLADHFKDLIDRRPRRHRRGGR